MNTIPLRLSRLRELADDLQKSLCETWDSDPKPAPDEFAGLRSDDYVAAVVTLARLNATFGDGGHASAMIAGAAYSLWINPIPHYVPAVADVLMVMRELPANMFSRRANCSRDKQTYAARLLGCSDV